MIENAGRSLAEVAIVRHRPASCTILAGPGGSGGGGLVAARHLHNRGVTVNVVLSEDESDGVPGSQLEVLRRLEVPVAVDPPPASVVIDAMIGYGLRSDPRGRIATMIRWANASDAPTLALDVPSGLDATSGRIGDPCIVAEATLTLALPTVGLLLSPQVVGDAFVADISVPPSVYAAMGLTAVSPFTVDPIVPLSDPGDERT